MLASAVLAALSLFGCGPGNAEVKSAKTAHYKGDKGEIFKALADAVKEKHPIAKADTTAFVIETTGHWYNPDGQTVADRMEDIRDVPDKSLHIHFIVALRSDGDAFVVDVKPKWFRRVAGSPQPQPLSEDDISIPGWAHGKVDAINVAVHDGLKQYEQQTVPQQVPAGGGSAAPAGSGAAPAPAPTAAQ